MEKTNMDKLSAFAIYKRKLSQSAARSKNKQHVSSHKHTQQEEPKHKKLKMENGKQEVSVKSLGKVVCFSQDLLIIIYYY